MVIMNMEEKVKEIIIDLLGEDETKVNPEASLIEDLGADSLDKVELIMALEGEFDIQISDQEAEKITTVKDAINYVEKSGFEITKSKTNIIYRLK